MKPSVLMTASMKPIPVFCLLRIKMSFAKPSNKSTWTTWMSLFREVEDLDHLAEVTQTIRTRLLEEHPEEQKQ